MTALAPPPGAVIAPTLPRLLTAAGPPAASGALRLASHRATYPVPIAPQRQPIESYIAAIEDSGLRGRGGAGFPTGRKMRTVSEGRGRPVVVVNGSEGEPASGKDALLLTSAPHLVLDGALLAAAAIGAGEVVVCIERTKVGAIRAVEDALKERAAAGEAMGNVRLVDLPPKYVAGEESAVVHRINGGEAKPTLTPPRPYQRGVDRRPTLIDNVETLCHLAQIIRWGPTWFRGQGTADEPGTMLLTVSGAVARRGICEIPVGMSMHEVLAGAEPTEPIRAVLVGGYYGTWISAADARHVAFHNASLRTVGSALGCGAVVVLPASACGLVETANVLGWLAGETAGQCGPCVHGLAAIAAGMNDLAARRANAQTVASLHRWAGQVEGRGGCSFPDGAVRLLRSALAVFAADVDRHIAKGPCVAARERPLLPVPVHAAQEWR